MPGELFSGDTEGCGHSLRSAAAFPDRNGFCSEQAQAQYAPSLPLQPTSLKARLDFRALEQKRLEARVALDFVCQNSAAAGEVWLDAVGFAQLKVSGSSGLQHTYDDQRIHLQWEKEWAVGEHREVVFEYVVQSPVDGLNFTVNSDKRKVRAVSVATDLESELARYWLPVIDWPAARTQLEFTIRAKKEYTILANGAQIGNVDHDDGTHSVTWKLDFVCPSYLICLAVGELHKVEAGSYEQLPLAWFGDKGMPAKWMENSLGKTKDMMKWMEARLGVKFPWPKYYQFFSPGAGGAMENISLVSWNELYALPDEAVGEFGWNIERVNAHEMTHSFFGDAVVIKDHAHCWLKESWATFLPHFWFEENGDPETARTLRLYSFWRYRTNTESYVRPIVNRVYDTTWQMFDAHTYPGGALRLHMLRKKLGDEVFWNAVTDYLKSNWGQTAETGHFRHAMERGSHLNLEPFFDQWFYTPGFPILDVKLVWHGKTPVIEIAQKQRDEKKGIPFFAFELDVTVVGDDGVPETQTAHFTKRSGTAQLAFRVQSVQQIHLDPEEKALFDVKSCNFPIAVCQGTLQAESTTIQNKYRCFSRLVSNGSAQYMAAARQCYEQEKSWGARAFYAKELGRVKSRTALALLAELLEKEQSAAVLYMGVVACLYQKHSALRRMAHSLLAREDQSCPGPHTRRFLLRHIGYNRASEEDVELLKQYANRDHEYCDIMRDSAFRSLGLVEEPDVFDFLVGRVDDTLSTQAYRGLLFAISRLGAALEGKWKKRAQEVLMSQLERDDHTPDLKRELIACFKRLKMPQALRSMKGIVSHQVYQDALLPALKAASKPDASSASASKIAALSLTVEELQKKVANLEAKLDLN